MASLSVLLCWRFCAHIRLTSSPLLGPARQRTWLPASRLWISSCRTLTGRLYVRLRVINPDGLIVFCGNGAEHHVEFSKGSVQTQIRCRASESLQRNERIGSARPTRLECPRSLVHQTFTAKTRIRLVLFDHCRPHSLVDAARKHVFTSPVVEKTADHHCRFGRQLVGSGFLPCLFLVARQNQCPFLRANYC